MAKRTRRRKDRLSKRKVSRRRYSKRRYSKRRVSRKKNPKRKYTKRMKGGMEGMVPTATGGGWFKCSKGHPFYVGSKGAAWANFCPACGEKFKSTIYAPTL